MTPDNTDAFEFADNYLKAKYLVNIAYEAIAGIVSDGIEESVGETGDVLFDVDNVYFKIYTTGNEVPSVEINADWSRIGLKPTILFGETEAEEDGIGHVTIVRVFLSVDDEDLFSDYLFGLVPEHAMVASN